jgi:hypothetical protein
MSDLSFTVDYKGNKLAYNEYSKIWSYHSIPMDIIKEINPALFLEIETEVSSTMDKLAIEEVNREKAAREAYRKKVDLKISTITEKLQAAFSSFPEASFSNVSQDYFILNVKGASEGLRISYEGESVCTFYHDKKRHIFTDLSRAVKSAINIIVANEVARKREEDSVNSENKGLDDIIKLYGALNLKVYVSSNPKYNYKGKYEGSQKSIITKVCVKGDDSSESTTNKIYVSGTVLNPNAQDYWSRGNGITGVQINGIFSPENFSKLAEFLKTIEIGTKNSLSGS